MEEREPRGRERVIGVKKGEEEVGGEGGEVAVAGVEVGVFQYPLSHGQLPHLRETTPLKHNSFLVHRVPSSTSQTSPSPSTFWSSLLTRTSYNLLSLRQTGIYTEKCGKGQEGTKSTCHQITGKQVHKETNTYRSMTME